MITLLAIGVVLAGVQFWAENGGMTKKYHLQQIVKDDIRSENPKEIEEHLEEYYGNRKPKSRRLEFFEENYAAYLEAEAESLAAEKSVETQQAREVERLLKEANTLRTVSLQALRELEPKK